MKERVDSMENKNQKIGLIIILSTVLFLAIIFIGITGVLLIGKQAVSENWRHTSF